MPHQALTPREQRLKKLAQMRIDNLKKMRATQQGRTRRPGVPRQPARPV